MSRDEAKRERITKIVSEILATGTSVESVVDMFADALRTIGFHTDADRVATSAGSQILHWIEDQAAKEQLLLESGRSNNPPLTRERWLVYKAIGVSLHDGTWRREKP